MLGSREAGTDAMYTAVTHPRYNRVTSALLRWLGLHAKRAADMSSVQKTISLAV
jgi:hypothetical protein